MTTADDLLYEAWGVIANASGGDWDDTQSPEWQEAARNWRDKWHQHLDDQKQVREVPGELTEMQLDPGVEARVSKLEQAMVSLAVSVAGLQTLVLQGVSAQQPMTRWQMAQDLDPEGEVELLDGSKIKVKDVPLGPDGMPEEEWAMKNCPCPTHEEKRSRKAAAEQQTKGTGLYL